MNTQRMRMASSLLAAFLVVLLGMLVVGLERGCTRESVTAVRDVVAPARDAASKSGSSVTAAETVTGSGG